MSKYCKPNIKGTCKYCGEKDRANSDLCDSGESAPVKNNKAPKNKSKPSPKRNETQLLEIVVEHCSSCDQFKDAAEFEKLKCRRIGSCGCLWNKLKSALFGCPVNRFSRDELLIQEFARNFSDEISS